MSIKYFCICLFLAACLVLSPAYGATGTVKYNTVYQQLDGFGGAAVYDCPKLVAHSKREEIYDLLFKDLGLEILRIRNTYGYSTDPTNAELAATAAVIAEAREPQRSPNLKTLLTPWSPPAYLKSNNSEISGTLKGGPSNYIYADYAQWWYDSLLEFAVQGVVVDILSIQNEPDQSTSYDSCRLDPTETATNAGYDKAYEAVWNKLNAEMGASAPQMWAADHSGYGTSHINALVTRVGSEKVDGFNFHLYGAGSYDNPDGMISGMTSMYNQYGAGTSSPFIQKPLHMTEYVRLNTTPNFDMAWRFAQHIYNSLYYLHTTSYFNWTLFRGYSTTSGGIVTMTTIDDYIIRPQYWFLKAYTYFTGQDWSVLGTSVSGTDAANLRISAFKNPDSNELTVVILNIATTSTNLNLAMTGFAPDSSEVYRSSATENWLYLGTYNPLLTLPPRSITTIALSGVAIPDTAPPSPDPMNWAIPPTATGATSITMTAVTALDDSEPVLYFFECITDGNKSSGWQTATTYEAKDLERNTEYAFRIEARDSAPVPHETAWSSTLSATTLEASVDIIGSWISGLTHAAEPGTGRGLIFFAHAERTTNNNAFGTTSVTYGGQPMTKIIDVNVAAPTTGGVVCASAFWLSEAGIAAATSGTFTVTWSAAPTSTGYDSVFLEGVNRTTPIGAIAVNGTTTGATITTSPLLTNAGDLVIDSATCSGTGSYTVNNGFVEALELTITSADSVSGYKGFKQAAGGNETPSVTHSTTTNRQVLLGFVVKAEHPPTVDAGDNIQILSSDQAQTTIQGTATDPEGDPVEFCWLEGDQLLLDWSPVGANGQAYLNLGTVPDLSVGNHTLTLKAREAIVGGLTISDKMVLTIDNSPPNAQPAPSHQVVQIGIDPIVVVADVADFDGDIVTYQWLKGSEVLASGSVQTVHGGAQVAIPDLQIPAGDSRFPLGVHQIELKVSDGVNPPVSSFVSVEVIDTTAPSISPVPSVTILWPPNHKLQAVTIVANAFDNDGGGVIHLGVTVQSSEPANTIGDGNTDVDYYIDSVNDQTGIIELQLRSERAGKGDGRTYTITITATDVSGNNSVAVVKISAPHDQRVK